MKLDCYRIHGNAPEIVPARPERMWMDRTPNRFAYRCTPITMANTTGLELLCPHHVALTWTGGGATVDIGIVETGKAAGSAPLVQSHFGNGIATFMPGHVFRTDPDWALWCRGSPNMCKDGLTPLEGLVETEWLPFTFTMNWRFTRPGTVEFRRGEPFCFVTPVPHVAMEAIRPRVMPLAADPQLAADHAAWKGSRDDFNARLAAREPAAMQAKWQRYDLKGEPPRGVAAPDTHRIKRRMRAPVAGPSGAAVLPARPAAPAFDAGRTRQNIIWIASYPKSGNTWVRVFLHNLRREMEGRGDEPLDLNRLHESSAWEIHAKDYGAIIGKPVMEATPAEIAGARPEVQRRLANGRDAPFLVKTHLTVGMDCGHPTINLDATLAAVYIVRNSLDVAVSYANHAGHSLDLIVEHMCTPAMKTVMTAKDVNETIGSWSQNVASWTGVYQRPVLFLRYEDLLNEPSKHFARLVRFMGWTPTEVQIDSAVTMSSFDDLKRLEISSGFNERPVTSPSFFRQGSTGKWASALSLGQKKRILSEHAPMMQRFGYVSIGNELTRLSAAAFPETRDKIGSVPFLC